MARRETILGRDRTIAVIGQGGMARVSLSVAQGNSGLSKLLVVKELRGEMASEFIKKWAATGRPCLIVSGYGEDAVPEGVTAISRLEKPVSPTVVIEPLSRELART